MNEVKSNNVNKLIKRIKSLQLVENMSINQKRRLLHTLKECKGNIGGETDIVNPDNLGVNENEFTGTGVPSTVERNVIAKIFDTKADFDSYVDQRRGIQITPKELQAISNFQKVQPQTVTPYSIRYENTDDFGNNDTTVIKKLREGSDFCWTAFTKYERAEEEGHPKDISDQGNDEGGESDMKNTGADAEQAEVTVNDSIRITKSITFRDEIQGADILSDLLEKLDI
jgi:hypothetical protein